MKVTIHTAPDVEVTARETESLDQLIEGVKVRLQSGIAHFVYLKKDGSAREAFGTTNADVLTTLGLPEREPVSSIADRPDTIVYFDLGSNGWRSCLKANVKINL